MSVTLRMSVVLSFIVVMNCAVDSKYTHGALVVSEVIDVK